MPKNATGRPKGRPRKDKDAILDEIIERLSQGESLRQICQDDRMPTARTVYNWVHEREDVEAAYLKSREAQADLVVDELLGIADNEESDVNRDRLKIDTRKWLAARMLPKRYSERQTLDVNIVDRTSELIEARKRIESRG